MEPFHRSVLSWHDLTCCNCYHAELSFWDHVSPWGGAGRSWVKGLCTQKDEDVVNVSKQGWSLTRLAFCQSFHCRLLQNSATENLALLLCEWHNIKKTTHTKHWSGIPLTIGNDLWRCKLCARVLDLLLRISRTSAFGQDACEISFMSWPAAGLRADWQWPCNYLLFISNKDMQFCQSTLVWQF